MLYFRDVFRLVGRFINMILLLQIMTDLQNVMSAEMRVPNECGCDVRQPDRPTLLSKTAPLYHPIYGADPSILNWRKISMQTVLDSTTYTTYCHHHRPRTYSHHHPVETSTPPPTANMHLMYLPESNGTVRRYTLKKVMDGQVTKSAHPARFSPDDKWSRHRIAVRKRFAVLLAQKSTLSVIPSFVLGVKRRRLTFWVE